MTTLEDVEGVTSDMVTKLRKNYITTVELLAIQRPWPLNIYLEVPANEAAKIIDNARLTLDTPKWQSGSEYEETLMSQPRLMIGSEKLDDLVMGGIPAGSVVELHGPMIAPMTVAAHQYAVKATMSKEEGGLEGRVLWIDTHSGFRPLLIRTIASRFRLQGHSVLDKITRIELLDYRHWQKLLRRIAHYCSSGGVRLVIFDSVGEFFVQSFLQSQMIEPEFDYHEMARLSVRLRHFCWATKALALVLNHVATFPMWRSAQLLPSPDLSVYTTYSSNRSWVFSAKYFRAQPSNKVNLQIGWGGVYDDTTQMREGDKHVCEIFNIDSYFQQWLSLTGGKRP